MVRDVEVLAADLAIPEAVAVLETGRRQIYPVVDGQNQPVGLVPRADALLWMTEGGHLNERLDERISDA